ncbi:MAG: FGGY family carbohydrate kinase, partial [Gallionella sp.]|nr:FGGY family carbohydrate kinase [Gallionella sp.]
YAAVAEAVLSECLAQTTARPPLGLCSQRSSFLIWERATGRPVTPLISWQDGRGAESCEALRGKEGVIRDLTGLPLAAYYLAPKLSVLLRENASWRERLTGGEWLLGTLDTFLIWRWTGGRHYLTDASMAARTLLMDIHSQQWSPQLCELFGIPLSILPEIRPSAGLNLRLENGLILQASVSDQSAALVASIATGQPEALVNLGTGGFVIRYLPHGRNVPEGYLQTLVWQDSARQAHFAGEGTLNSIASALAPYAVDACRTEDLARDDIFCLAEPSGLGAPYFRRDLGLSFSDETTGGTTSHLTRLSKNDSQVIGYSHSTRLPNNGSQVAGYAPVERLPAQRVATLLLEGIIFRVARILEDMHREFGIERVYLSGGLSSLPCLQQGIAQCVPFAATYRLSQSNTSLIGAARLAAGVPLAGSRCAEKVDVSQFVPGLPEKYARWKVWLDGLLCS